MSHHISIIDCSIETPAIHCFNRLTENFKTSFSYHRPPVKGMSSLLEKSDEGAARGHIIFGSASNVEDNLSWHKELVVFIKDQLTKGVPVFAICFGHQLMADAFGGKVQHVKSPEGLRGLREMTIVEDRFGFSKKQKLSVFKYHSYEVTDPGELKGLGTSEECQFDALYHPSLPYFSVQGHPESSLFFIENEIKTSLTPWQIDQGQKDGLFIISQFISQVEKS